MEFFITIHSPRADQLAQVLKAFKVVHVETNKDPFDLESYYLYLAKGIGELVGMEEDLTTGNKTSDFWTDIKYDSSIANSYRHSNTRQPLHTDGSYESNAPDISFFYCLRQAKFGGATTFLDYQKLISMLEIYDTFLLERLRTTPVCFAKGNDSKIAPIIGNGILTWNYFRAVKTPETRDLIEAFHNFLEKVVVEAGVVYPLHLHSGNAVFFWDEQLLHGRNAFLGDRWLRKGGVKWTLPRS